MMNRRDFLKSMAAAGLFGAFAHGVPGAVKELLADNKKKFKGKARTVIEIWMWGGPSALETFDPKPNAGNAYNNGLKSIPTNVPGIEISELLPKLAKHADKYSIVRSMTHPHNGHETATYLMQTGREPGGGRVYPAIGAVVAMFKSKTYKGDIPPYVILTVPKGRFSEVGFLSEKYAPLVTGGNPASQRFVVDGISPPDGVDPADMTMRKNLLSQVDALGRAMPGNSQFAEFDRAGNEAFALVEGPSAKVFDLTEESAAMRDRYGRNTLGQSFLIARRLAEKAVPYITINAQGWDTHKRHFETMKQKAPQFDQGVAALIEDLAERGILDDTLIWISGEFGRTPKIDFEAPWNGGRGHYCRCFSALLAGGGIQGGKVIGESNATSERVASRPVAPQDLLGTIYECCGIDPDGPLPNPIGLNVPVLPPESEYGRLRELYPI